MKDWKKEEARVAKQLGGQQVPGSGSSPMGGRGDVRTSRFLIEVKETKGRGIRLTEALLDKTEIRAFKEGKEPALSLNVNGRRWVALRFEWFARLEAAQRMMDALKKDITPDGERGGNSE